MVRISLQVWQKYIIWGTIAAALFVVIGISIGIMVSAQDRTTLRLGDGVFQAKILEKSAERVRGLSGTDRLPEANAMLFVFTDDAEHSIWMKDMNYNIDIVWLNKDKKVVHIRRDIAPSTYPDRFSSPVPARYVIEFVSGTVGAKNIRIGQAAHFDIANKKVDP